MRKKYYAGSGLTLLAAEEYWLCVSICRVCDSLCLSVWQCVCVRVRACVGACVRAFACMCVSASVKYIITAHIAWKLHNLALMCFVVAIVTVFYCTLDGNIVVPVISMCTMTPHCNAVVWQWVDELCWHYRGGSVSVNIHLSTHLFRFHIILDLLSW